MPAALRQIFRSVTLVQNMALERFEERFAESDFDILTEAYDDNYRTLQWETCDEFVQPIMRALGRDQFAMRCSSLTRYRRATAAYEPPS